MSKGVASFPSVLQTLRLTCIGSSPGWVPLIKISVLSPNPSWARYPETESTETVTIPLGTSKPTLGLPARASKRTLRQMGEAPDTPEATFDIGVLSLLPTQTPTKAWVLPHIVPLSLLSFVVPVLTAAVLPEIFRSELVPNTIERAELSERMLAMRYACSSDKTLFFFSGFTSSRTFPSASSTLRTDTGSTL